MLEQAVIVSLMQGQALIVSQIRERIAIVWSRLIRNLFPYIVQIC